MPILVDNASADYVRIKLEFLERLKINFHMSMDEFIAQVSYVTNEWLSQKEKSLNSYLELSATLERTIHFMSHQITSVTPDPEVVKAILDKVVAAASLDKDLSQHPPVKSTQADTTASTLAETTASTLAETTASTQGKITATASTQGDAIATTSVQGKVVAASLTQRQHEMVFELQTLSKYTAGHYPYLKKLLTDTQGHHSGGRNHSFHDAMENVLCGLYTTHGGVADNGRGPAKETSSEEESPMRRCLAEETSSAVEPLVPQVCSDEFLNVIEYQQSVLEGCVNNLNDKHSVLESQLSQISLLDSKFTERLNRLDDKLHQFFGNYSQSEQIQNDRASDQINLDPELLQSIKHHQSQIDSKIETIEQKHSVMETHLGQILILDHKFTELFNKQDAKIQQYLSRHSIAMKSVDDMSKRLNSCYKDVEITKKQMHRNSDQQKMYLSELDSKLNALTEEHVKQTQHIQSLALRVEDGEKSGSTLAEQVTLLENAQNNRFDEVGVLVNSCCSKQVLLEKSLEKLSSLQSKLEAELKKLVSTKYDSEQVKSLGNKQAASDRKLSNLYDNFAHLERKLLKVDKSVETFSERLSKQDLSVNVRNLEKNQGKVERSVSVITEFQSKLESELFKQELVKKEVERIDKKQQELIKKLDSIAKSDLDKTLKEWSDELTLCKSRIEYLFEEGSPSNIKTLSEDFSTHTLLFKEHEEYTSGALTRLSEKTSQVSQTLDAVTPLLNTLKITVESVEQVHLSGFTKFSFRLGQTEQMIRTVKNAMSKRVTKLEEKYLELSDILTDHSEDLRSFGAAIDSQYNVNNDLRTCLYGVVEKGIENQSSMQELAEKFQIKVDLMDCLRDIQRSHSSRIETIETDISYCNEKIDLLQKPEYCNQEACAVIVDHTQKEVVSVENSETQVVQVEKSEEGVQVEKSEEVVQVEKSEEVVQVEKSEEVVQVEKSEEVVQVEKSEEVVQVEKSEEVVQVEKSEEGVQVEKSEEVVQVEKSEEVVQVEKSEEVVQVEKSEEVVQVEKSEEVVQVEKSEEVVQVEKSEEGVQVEKSEEVVQVEKSEEGVQVEKSEEVVQVEKSEEVVQVEKSEEVVQVEKSEEGVQVEKSEEVVQVEKSEEGVQVEKSEEVVQVEKSEEVVQVEKSEEGVQVEKSEEVFQVEKSEEVVQVEKSEEGVQVEKSEEGVQVETFKNSENQLLYSEKSEDQGEHTEKSKDQVEHTEKSKDQVEHTEKSKDQVEHTEKSKDQVEHTEKSKDQVEHTEKSKDQVEHTEKSKDQVEHTEKPKDQVEHTEKPKDQHPVLWHHYQVVLEIILTSDFDDVESCSDTQSLNSSDLNLPLETLGLMLDKLLED
ncbi:myosin-13 [Biomphalaria pfeifferi]|uniref:Myosin-13 n=1 Tax=Biomphalaria pfeifferi TaxID=112525 RepID=A0AAD8FLE8_BIOPF|nr:myosin-13 [Biomphalaria pfeifferi]